MVTTAERRYSLPVEVESRRLPEVKNQESESPWKIVIDRYNPERQGASEVVNSLSNGRIGFRASVSGVNNGIHSPATYLAGFFEQKPRERGEKKDPENVADLVNIPDFLHFDFHNGKELFDIDHAKLLSYRSELDLRNGVLRYQFRWEDEKGRITKVEQSTFVSQTDENIAAFRVSLTPENYSDTITLSTGINGRVENKGRKYLSEEDKGWIPSGGIYYSARTKHKGQLVSLASTISVSSGGQKIEEKPQVVSGDEMISQQIAFAAQEGRTYSLDKKVAVYSSRDKGVADPVMEACQKVADSQTFDELIEQHSQRWQEIWKEIGVEIVGNEKDNEALRFNLFALRQLASLDETVSIAAKGESNKAGDGYMGHVFWDSEVFMLPFLIHSAPQHARALLMYRYNTLSAARQKAKDQGYEGALYAWESADTGEEETPEQVVDSEGRIVPIYTGSKEYHISADIAYAISEYVLATNDREFMRNFGAEIIAETARFWVSKGEYNAYEGRFEFNRVIGPDEYHERGPDGEVGVNNNYYNNAMAQWNIRKAVEVWNELKDYPEARAKMGLTELEAEAWKIMADKIYIPYDPQTKLYRQFDGYDGLEEAEIPPEVTDMDSFLKGQGKEPYKFKPGKQADVLLTHKLLGEDPEVVKANWDYYAPRCSDGSSLSDATHAEIAAKIGYVEEAYERWVRASRIDLENKKRNNHFGIHAAALGGLWQALVYGFAGAQMHDNKLVINPHLPDAWRALQFNMRYKGLPINAKISHKSLSLSFGAGSSEMINLEIAGQMYSILPGENYTFALKSKDERFEEAEAAGAL